MIELKGIPVSSGIAIKRAFLLDAEDYRIAQRYIKAEEVESELARFNKAHETARRELIHEQERYKTTLGAEIAQIFKFHQFMLEDPTLVDEIRKRITSNKLTPEYAVSRAFLTKVKAFRSLTSEF